MFNQYEDILRVDEVAEVLGAGKNTIYALLYSGELKGFRIGRMWKIPRESVEFYMSEKMQVCKNKKIPRGYMLLGYRSCLYFIFS